MWVLCANFRHGNGMVDRCIAEPNAQSWSQSGMHIFQPQNLCPVTKGYEARNSAGTVDVTGKFSTAGGLRSRRQSFIGGGPDQQLDDPVLNSHRDRQYQFRSDRRDHHATDYHAAGLPDVDEALTQLRHFRPRTGAD